MPILHLGVIDQPYAEGAKSTGDVAEILESKYEVMGKFAEKHEQDIAGDLENSLEGVLENMMLGGPTVAPDQAFAAGTSAIEHRFKQFLSLKEMDSLGVPGVPTQAALAGKSKRFKSGYGPKPRPSFIDTGLYQANFKAWID
jgi:hypothetical protein